MNRKKEINKIILVSILLSITLIVGASGVVEASNPDYGSDTYYDVSPDSQEVFLVNESGTISEAWKGNNTGIYNYNGATWNQIDTGNKIKAIQKAINNATTKNDTIIVGNGTYNGTLTTDNSNITKLQGHNNKPTINGENLDYTINSTISNLTITGLNITNSGDNSAGIYISNDNSETHNITITNNTITQNNYGISVISVSIDYSSITGNNITENNRGIYFSNSISTNITGNNILGNGNGIRITSSSHNNTVTNNSIKNNYVGVNIRSSNDNSVINNNIVSNTGRIGKGIYIYDSDSSNVRSNNVTSNDGDGITIEYGSCYNNVTSNEIKSNKRGGIVIYDSSNYNHVIDNTIKNNTKTGVRIYSSSNYNNVSDNEFIIDGLSITDGSEGTTVRNNSVNGESLVFYENDKDKLITESKTEVGQVVILDSENITIQNTHINKTDTAIILANTTNSTITKNTLTNNTENGIKLYGSENNVNKNSITNNTGYGMNIRGLKNSVNNTDITNNDDYGMNLENSNNNVTESSITNNNGYGINVLGSNNSLIRNNIRNNNGTGVKITPPVRSPFPSIEYNNIASNNITNNSGVGVKIVRPYNRRQSPSIQYNNITGNSITRNKYYGIFLKGWSVSRRKPVKHNYITNNTLNNNNNEAFKGKLVTSDGYVDISKEGQGAIALYFGDSNTIRGNIVEDNYKNGLTFYNSIDNNVTTSIIENNKYQGVYLTDSSKGNSFYLNNFLKSSNGNVFIGGSGGDNTWISPDKINYSYQGTNYSNRLGNYWDDYEGFSSGDGTGESPYNISQNSEDTEPLIGEFNKDSKIIDDDDYIENYRVSISSEDKIKTVDKDENANYELVVKNEGNVNVDLNLSVINPRADVSITNKSLSVNAGGNETINMNVSSSSPGDYKVTIFAVSDRFGGLSSLSTTTKVKKYGVTMSADTTSATVKPDKKANYTLTVKNTGNVGDTYDLSVPKNDTNYRLLTDSLTVDPGQTKSIEVGLLSGPIGDYKATVNASSTNNTDKWTTKNLELSVEQEEIPGVALSIDPRTKRIERDGEPNYTVKVKNTGNVEDTYSLTNESDATTILENTSMALGPGESKSTSLTVSNLSEFKNYGTMVKAVSSNYDLSSSKTVYTQVVRSVDVSAVPGSQTTSQGNASTYTIKVMNTGNQTHDYELSIPYNSTQTTANLTDKTINDLDPGEEDETTLTLNNTKSLNGDSRRIEANIQANVVDKPNKSDSTTVNSLYTDDEVFGVSVSSDETEQAINQDKNATYLLTIKNLGNTENTINITKSVSKGILDKEKVTLNASGNLGDTKVIKFTQESSEPGEVVITANSSGVKDSITLNTRVTNIEVENITNSDVDGSSTVTNSKVESSTVTNSEIINNSTVNNTQITNSKINNTIVKESDLSNVKISNGSIEDNQINEGVVTVDGTEFEVNSEDPKLTIKELVGSDQYDSNLASSSDEKTQITGENSNVTLNMTAEDNYVGGSMGLQRSNVPPNDVDTENTNTSQYVRIKPSINVEESTEYSIITLSYTQQWIEEENIDEDTVAIYRYNEDGDWIELVEAGNPSFCNGVEKNTEENYVRANVTKFSTYEIDGEKIQPPKEEDEGGTGGLDVGRTDKGVRKLYLSGTNPSRTISQVQENDTIIVNTEPTNNNQSLKGFNTTAKKYLGSVSVKINRLGKETDKAPSTPNTYTYTEINLENTESNEIKNSSLTFRVNKTWLNKRNASKVDVTGKIFTNGTWEPLNTKHVNETEDFYEFKAETSEFGVFSIGVKPRIITTKLVDTKIKNQNYQELMNQNFNQIYLGKAGTDKVEPKFTRNTMTYQEKTYESTWKQEDYAIIQINKYETHIVGTHRYGTEAAIKYYKEEGPQDTTLIKWEDKNNDEEVQFEEIEVAE